MQQAANILASCIRNENTSRDQLEFIGTTCARPYALVIVSCMTYRSKAETNDVLEFLKKTSTSNVATYANGQIIILTAYADARHIIDAISKLEKQCKTTSVISLPFENMSTISQQYELALYCLSRAGTYHVVDAKDWALPFIKKSITESLNLDGLTHPALAKLAHYDELNQSNLLQTLKVYLEHDRNAQRCANMLYLHRNSLQYRVRRIQEIADIDLDDPEERTYLRLSFILCGY